MTLAGTQRPAWLTFDCYGTLIQWDEGLIAVVRSILDRQPGMTIDPGEFIAIFDRHEHKLEQERPHKSFAP
jgi:2-haloacid dehalogenase